MMRRVGLARRVMMLLGAACAAAGCARHGGEAASDAEPNPVVNVRIAELSERMIPSTVAAPGQWRAANEVTANAPFAATVESLKPRVGDHVRKGETIALLVTRESQAALRGAQLMLRQAKDPVGNEEAHRAAAQARHDLVRVPFAAATSGIVVRRGADPGAEVAEGAELLAIVPERELVFEGHIALKEAGRIVAGMPATIAMEGGVVVKAVVQRRLPNTSAVDQNALVWLTPAGALPAGALDQFGTAAIQVGAPRRVVAVPDSALVEDDLTGEVQVAQVGSAGLAVWTPVRLGAFLDGWHELLEPSLPPGTRVIIVGQHGMPDSTRVRPQ